MPKISKQKKEKISEQILYHLYTIFPKSLFTSKIAEEIARDEEFVRSLLDDLLKKEFVISIKKNPFGGVYSKRVKWRLSNKTQIAYKGYQRKQGPKYSQNYKPNLF